VTNPVLTLVATGEQVQLEYDITAGHEVEIDFAKPSVVLDPAGSATNLMEFISKTSTFFRLAIGENTVRLTASSGTGSCSITWYHKYKTI